MSNDENNKLIPSTPTSNKLGTFNQPTKVGMAGRLQMAKQAGSLASDSLLDFKNYPNRIVIAVDDSGSMSSMMHDTQIGSQINGNHSRMEMAKKACEGFLSVCNPADTVLGMYTISTDKTEHLNWNYTNVLVLIKELTASGGTPTFSTLRKILANEKLTRVVVISDGHSSDSYRDDSKNILKEYKEKGIIIDAVFIGVDGDSGIAEMKEIAETTGGQFIHFKDANDFKSKFKYLAPAYYGMLQAGELKV